MEAYCHCWLSAIDLLSQRNKIYSKSRGSKIYSKDNDYTIQLISTSFLLCILTFHFAFYLKKILSFNGGLPIQNLIVVHWICRVTEFHHNFASSLDSNTMETCNTVHMRLSCAAKAAKVIHWITKNIRNIF